MRCHAVRIFYYTDVIQMTKLEFVSKIMKVGLFSEYVHRWLNDQCTPHKAEVQLFSAGLVSPSARYTRRLSKHVVSTCKLTIKLGSASHDTSPLPSDWNGKPDERVVRWRYLSFFRIFCPSRSNIVLVFSLGSA